MDRTEGGARARAVQHTGDLDPPQLRRAREAVQDRHQQRGPASLKDIPARTFSSAELEMHKEQQSRNDFPRTDFETRATFSS